MAYSNDPNQKRIPIYTEPPRPIPVNDLVEGDQLSLCYRYTTRRGREYLIETSRYTYAKRTRVRVNVNGCHVDTLRPRLFSGVLGKRAAWRSAFMRNNHFMRVQEAAEAACRKLERLGLDPADIENET